MYAALHVAIFYLMPTLKTVLIMTFALLIKTEKITLAPMKTVAMSFIRVRGLNSPLLAAGSFILATKHNLAALSSLISSGVIFTYTSC